jgi:cation:H+ antiporter
VIFTAPLALLLLGLGAIVWGTKVVIDNAVVVAHHHRISDFFIGAVVLAIGSDLPELVVSIDAALRQLAGQQTANLIVGNAIGSCFGQLGLVMGLGGLVGRLNLPRGQVVRHGAVLVTATLLLMLVGLDGRVHRLEGLAMALAFGTYLFYVLSDEGLVSGRGSGGGERPERASVSVAMNWLRLGVGLAIVVASAELIVRMAMTLAIQWGVDQSFIGIAIVGVGTSLPEVVISLVALMRRRVGLSVGNLLGSNILDTLLPVGLAAAIVPLPFDSALLLFDLPMLLGLTVLAVVLLYRRGGVRWPQGLVVLTAYLSYLVTITLTL